MPRNICRLSDSSKKKKLGTVMIIRTRFLFVHQIPTGWFREDPRREPYPPHSRQRPLSLS